MPNPFNWQKYLEGSLSYDIDKLRAKNYSPPKRNVVTYYNNPKQNTTSNYKAPPPPKKQYKYPNVVDNLWRVWQYTDTGTGGGGFVKPADQNVDLSNLGGSNYGYGMQENYGGGEAQSTPKVTWNSNYSIEGAPTWWKGVTPSTLNPDTEFASILNTLIPFLSVEDQRQMATSLSTLFPDAFSDYSPEKTNYDQPASTITNLTEQYMLSQKRATDVLSGLDKMREATGKSETDFGPGYSYVRNLAQTIKDFGAKEGQNTPTRRQILNMYSALDPMLAEAQGERLGAYGEAARVLTQPFFGAGKLVNVSKDDKGNYVFGKENKAWF